MASPQTKLKAGDEEEVEVVEVASEPEKKEPTQELEEDANKDSSAQIQDTVTFLTPDTTLNVLPSPVVLACFQEGGLGSLVAGARANVGLKSGRYMFEAKILEHTRSGGKPLFRIGFSAEGSLFLGEDDNSIGFDSDGYLVSNKKKIKCSQPFSQDVMVAVVLNLDPMSPNANTISLFKDGVRVAQPQPLPDTMRDRTLFPAFSFKNATVHYNFGTPVVPLPFTCKVLQEAATQDAVVTKYDAPDDGKCTVLFPVCLPDEGGFDWLDIFLTKNPDYTELSDRALLDWSVKSGVHSKGKAVSNDKPDNISGEFASLRSVLLQIAAIQPRNFVVMEVKGNLIKDDRAAALAKFQGSGFKTVADVIVGDPPPSYKKVVQEKMLKAKQVASDTAWRAKQHKEKQEWIARKKRKELERKANLFAKAKAKRLEEAKRAKEESQKKLLLQVAAKKAAAEGKIVLEDKEEVEEVKQVEEPKEEEPDDPDEPEPVEEDPPVVELTLEDQQERFVKHPLPDLTPYALSTSFTKFTIPDADEGFDSLKFSWSAENQAVSYLKEWTLEKKHTTRVEDIRPSPWFLEKSKSWNAAVSSWKTKQNEFKADRNKKAADKAAKTASKVAAERKAKIEAAKKAEDGEANQEDDTNAPTETEEESAGPEVDFEGVDVFGVDDVCDIGSNMPLFKDFQYEDYALMGLRAEMHFMAHAFGKDVDDPDRKGMHVDHVLFYYQKYFNKILTPQMYGVKTLLELVQLIDDTIHIDVKSQVIESLVPPDLETHGIFVRFAEEARRVRTLAIDLGDDSARLRIQQHNQGNLQKTGEKRQWEGGSDGKSWGGDGKKGKWWKKW